MPAAIRLPTEEPHIVRGIKSYSWSAFNKPAWNLPKVAPPLSRRAVWPNECLVSAKNVSFYCSVSLLVLQLYMSLMHLITSLWYFSISLFVPKWHLLYRSGLEIPPIFLIKSWRRQWLSVLTLFYSLKCFIMR